MLAVIFRAQTTQAAQDDARYPELAEHMRRLAIDQYGCLEFFAISEGDQELAISYWESAEAIRAWKQDAEHLRAQQLGRDEWYQRYQVQVVEVLRQYEKRR